MPTQVTKAAGNRYCQARMEAAKWNEKLLTRAGASELLPGVTEDSLKKYELDLTRVPNTVVALMADTYNCPELRQWYCVHECPLGKNLRDISSEMTPERAVIRLLNTAVHLETAIKNLVKLADAGAFPNAGAVNGLDEIKEQLIECRARIDENIAMVEKTKGRSE